MSVVRWRSLVGRLWPGWEQAQEISVTRHMVGWMLGWIVHFGGIKDWVVEEESEEG